MSRFNTPATRTPAPGGPIKTVNPSTVTALGGIGYRYDDVSQLILLAANNMVGQETFHEKADDRDQRFIDLAQKVTREHPELVVKMLPWMRSQMRMRTSSIIAAAEAAHILSGNSRPQQMVFTKTAPGAPRPAAVQATAREVVANTLQRADEPGEFMAYWVSRFGQKVPHGVKRGVGDAILRLYNQRAALKYDAKTDGRWSMGGVIEYCGHKPDSVEQRRLFDWLVTKAKGRSSAAEIPQELSMIRANQELRRQALTSPELLLHPTRLSMAGVNWEDAIPQAVGSGVSPGAAWSAIIPAMNVMALLRNLRKFDDVGITSAAVEAAVNKLQNPLDVMRSRVLPMRIWQAYRQSVSDRWKWPLQQALDAALVNVPNLPGRTLILVDTSGSMNSRLSAKSDVLRWDTAVLFALAVARRCDAVDVVSFSTNTKGFPAVKGETVLQGMTRWQRGGFNLNHGTSTAAAVRKHFLNHDRVIILTDEQARDGEVFASVPASTMCITFNLAGYKVGHAAVGSPRRVTIGGLSDAAFQLLPVLELAGRGMWPWDADIQFQ